MLHSQTLSNTQDLIFVASLKCLGKDYATINCELTHLMGEAREWVGGLESS
jgi:hypothetical protein